MIIFPMVLAAFWSISYKFWGTPFEDAVVYTLFNLVWAVINVAYVIKDRQQ